jgi:nitrate reductase assembly molybdenum cofactor insertion protein NarJ
MQSDVEENHLLREAAEWRLISLLFDCPTDGWREQVAALAAVVEDTNLKAAAEMAQTEASEGLYHSVFGPGGPAPPREVSYRDWSQPGYLLSELAAYYDAFSYHTGTSEPADHVAVETGFVGYLLMKQLYALASSDAEHAGVAAEAVKNFIDEHLASIAEPLAAALETSGISYLALAGAALLGRVGPRRDRQTARSLPVLTEDDESVFECGEV